MSMNELHQQLHLFNQALTKANESFLASYRSLRQSHDDVSTIWNDDFRKSYDAKWAPLEDIMERYVMGEASKYEDFCQQKLKQIEQYLQS